MFLFSRCFPLGILNDYVYREIEGRLDRKGAWKNRVVRGGLRLDESTEGKKKKTPDRVCAGVTAFVPKSVSGGCFCLLLIQDQIRNLEAKKAFPHLLYCRKTVTCGDSKGNRSSTGRPAAMSARTTASASSRCLFGGWWLHRLFFVGRSADGSSCGSRGSGAPLRDGCPWLPGAALPVPLISPQPSCRLRSWKLWLASLAWLLVRRCWRWSKVSRQLADSSETVSICGLGA